MTREEAFVTLVQTALIAAAVQKPNWAHPGTMISWMNQAIKAADQIPGDMEVNEAAIDFAVWAIEPDGDRPNWI